MRYFIFILLSASFVLPTFAEVMTVSSSSAVPSGYSFNSSTSLYENGTDTKYSVAAGSNGSASSSTYNGSDGENILSSGNDLTNADLRAGNVDMSTIPKIIVSVINVLLGIAGTVAIFSLIYHAVQMQINSGITGDSSGVDKAKKGMIGALIGFVIAILAWFLVTRAVELLSGAS